MRVVAFLTLLLCACSDVSLPDHVLPSKKMEAVLYDVIRSDEMVDFLSLNDSTYRFPAHRKNLYDSIFQLHKVKKEDFQKSMKFYQGRPDLLKVILDDMQKKATDTATTSRPLIH